MHRVRSGRKLWSADAGFTLGFKTPAAVSSRSDAQAALTLQVPMGASGVRDLLGNRAAEKILLEPNSHLSHPLTAMPVLRGEHPDGDTLLASVFGASLKGGDPLPERLGAFTATTAVQRI